MRPLVIACGAMRAIIYGGLVVGVLDALDAIMFFGLRSGATPLRIFQSIASGWLGRASYQGGMRTAALGVFFHFAIAFAIVAVYYVASRRLPVLTGHPVICGIGYGIVVYAVMNLVVVPLSNAGTSPFVLPVFLNGIAIHMVGVGLPSAWFASRAQ